MLAKAPVPGQVKTRLCPPFSPAEAAGLAESALVDTLEAVSRTPCTRRVVMLDGEPGAWLLPGFTVLPQSSGALDVRLADAFAAVTPPTLLVGMDTPQLIPGHLEAAIECLLDPEYDAVLGPCPDGGYWAVGLRRRMPGAFEGVPMSTDATFTAQFARFHRLGLRTAVLHSLRDVDQARDAFAVANFAPQTRFASSLRLIDSGISRHHTDSAVAR